MCCQTGQRTMQRRPAALSLPGPDDSPEETMVSPPRPPPFAGRNSQPEIFTFDLQDLPTATPAQLSRRPPSRRPRRVLYPSQARRNRYLPVEERNPALRWLYILCLVVFVQVCLEEEDMSAPRAQGIAAPALKDSAPLMRASPSLMQEQMRAPSLHHGVQEAAHLSSNLTCHELRGLIVTL